MIAGMKKEAKQSQEKIAVTSLTHFDTERPDDKIPIFTQTGNRSTGSG